MNGLDYQGRLRQHLQSWRDYRDFRRELERTEQHRRIDKMQGESRKQVGRDIEEAAVPRSGPGRPQKEKREWPQKLSTLLFFFIFLGAGILVGIVASLHLMGILKTQGVYFNLNNAEPATSVILRSEVRVQHNMQDAELLWRASMVHLRPGVPIERKVRVAFMFLSVGPLPLATVWEKFFFGHEDLFSVYVHAHPSYVPEIPEVSVFFGRHVPSQEVIWGDVSIVDAERRLLANALLDSRNERFVLLSETCVPLFNFTFIYDYLTKSEGSFTGSFDDPGPYGRGRYLPAMMPEISIHEWRKGSRWFEVKRDHAIAVVADVKYYPKLRDFCRPNCYIDEHYVQTMLSIEYGKELASRSVTYVDWSRGGSHPATFNAGDVTDEFLERLQNDRNCEYNGQPGHVCWLFGRKFSPGSMELILKQSLYT